MPNQQGYRYPGLHPFQDTELDRLLFKGRENESRTLLHLILSERLVVLFGKSGIGKTSLLNAGVFHTLRRRNYLPFTIRFNDLKSNLLDLIYEKTDARAEVPDPDARPEDYKKTLWQYFKTVEFWSDKDELLTPILVLDQFEELFTLNTEKARQDFAVQLAALVRGRLPGSLRRELAKEGNTGSFRGAAPDVKIVIATREDYLAHLEELASDIPAILSNRFRLTALTPEQARKAIEEPARLKNERIGTQGFAYTSEAIDEMLAFLGKHRKGQTASGVQEIEPFQLQLLCKHLEKKVRGRQDAAGTPREIPTIGTEHLGGEAGMDNVLSRYYYDTIQEFPRMRLGPGSQDKKGLLGKVRRLQPVHFPQWAIRDLCEHRLITASGHRNNRHEEEILHEIGVSQSDLEQLVQSRLLRREPRLDHAFYELSHDSLVAPVQAAGGRRRTGMNIVALGATVLVVVLALMSVDVVKSWLALAAFQDDLKALRQGETNIEDFKAQHRRAQRIVIDPAKVTAVYNDFIVWHKKTLHNEFLAWDTPYLDKADAVYDYTRKEYPADDILLSEMMDTLRVRRIQEVKEGYRNLLANRVEGYLDNALVFLSMKNTSFTARYGVSSEITHLLLDLADKRGETLSIKDLTDAARKVEVFNENQGQIARMDETAGRKVEALITALERGEQASIELYDAVVEGNVVSYRVLEGDTSTVRDMAIAMDFKNVTDTKLEAYLPIERATRLPEDQSFSTPIPKAIIALHSTEGGLAESSIDSWMKDDQDVATAYIIARDGRILEIFDPSRWAWQFGLRSSEWTREGRETFEQGAIGISLANEGGLIEEQGQLYAFGRVRDQNRVPHQQVYHHNEEYRGFRHYANFTTAQYEAVISLIEYLTDRYAIPRSFLDDPLVHITPDDAGRFEGILTHANVNLNRQDPGPALDWNRIMQGVKGITRVPPGTPR